MLTKVRWFVAALTLLLNLGGYFGNISINKGVRRATFLFFRGWRRPSGADDRSVEHTVIATIFEVFCVGIARGGLLVDIDAEPGLVVRIDVALANFGGSRKHLACLFVEEGFFLDAKVRGYQVQM